MKIIRYFKNKNVKNDKGFYLKTYEQFKPSKEYKELLLKSDSLIQKVEKKNIEFYSKDTIVSSKTIKPQDAYKLIDSNFESFFNNKDYNLKNFNNLLLTLTEQNELIKAINAFEKMKLMNIEPNVVSYIHLIQNYGKNYKINKSEELFEIAIKKFGICKELINSIIFVYSRNHKPHEAERIMNYYKSKDFVPDLAIYTTLIVGYKNLKKSNDVWRIYDLFLETDLEGDDVLYGLLIKVCADTRDAEKAKQYYEYLLNSGHKSTCLPYNSLIKAFASRNDVY